MATGRVVVDGLGSRGAAGSNARRGSWTLAWLGVAGCVARAEPRADPVAASEPTPVVRVPLEGLTPADPFECNGPERHVIEAVLIQTDGNGVTLQGSCSVLIRGSHIAAGGNGIEIRGAGSVEIEGSVVEGALHAVEMHGGAQLSARATRFRGRLATKGAAIYIDGGGNLWEE
jgi:hypothetical protein